MQRFKKAFTLLEVIIALSLFEFVMVGVIVAVNRAYTYVQSTKIQVMAVNLAREGVERMYTIRDTNRRKHSAEKDKYWLITDPMTGNNEPPVMSTGVYVLNLKSTSNGQQYPSLSGIIPTRDDDNFYNNFDKYTGDQEIWRMQFTGDILQFSGNVPPNPPGVTSITGVQNLMEADAKFYRIVRIYGLYNKNADNANSATSCTIENCTSGNLKDPKELRFCVKVWHFSTFRGSTELCGVMTNFRE